MLFNKFSLVIAISILISSVPNLSAQNNTTIFDLDNRNMGAVKYYSTNYGIFGNNVTSGMGGYYWPKTTLNQYVFGSGFWFAARKDFNGERRKYVATSYNPNNGRSWFAPGRYNDESKYIFDTVLPEDTTLSFNQAFMYQNYISTEYKPTGEFKYSPTLPSWPIWKIDDKSDYNNWTYEGNLDNRNITNYPNGPLYASDESIFSCYHDTYLEFYDDIKLITKTKGYPIGLQVDQMVYSWASKERENDIAIFYLIENISGVDLYDCWFAQIVDMDLAVSSQSSEGATNDRTRYFNSAPELQMAIAWSGLDKGENGMGFGYLGISLFMTPQVDDDGYVVNNYDAQFADQIGLMTYRNWTIADDLSEDESRYNFISSGVLEGDLGAGDKRGLHGSGPFHMRAGDKVIFGFLFTHDMPQGSTDPDGTDENASNIVSRVRDFHEFVYTRGFIASVLKDFGLNSSPFSIYPNPAIDEITISSPELPYSDRLTICDLKGNVLVEQRLESMTEIRLSTKLLPQGSYLVNIHNGFKKATKLLKIAR